MNGKGTKSVWAATMLAIDLSQKEPKWQAIKQNFEPRRALTAAGYDGNVYVIGGLTTSGRGSRSVDIYDPVKKAWTKGPDIPEPDMNGFSPAAAVAGGELYLSVADGKVFGLSKKRDAWNAIAAPERPRFVHRLVPAGDDLLLAVGGSSKKGNVAMTEAIVPSKALPKTPASEKK